MACACWKLFSMVIIIKIIMVFLVAAASGKRNFPNRDEEKETQTFHVVGTKSTNNSIVIIRAGPN